MNKLLPLLLLLLLPLPSHAADKTEDKIILRATCEHLKGARFDSESPIDDTISTKSYFVIFERIENGKPLKYVAAQVGGYDFHAFIVDQGDGLITAAHTHPEGGLTILITFYPQAGIVYYSQHRTFMFKPNANLFGAKCQFANF